MMRKSYKFVFSICFAILAAIPIDQRNTSGNNHDGSTDDNLYFGTPSNPVLDRARGYLTKGKFQTAVTNYGSFTDWYNNPSGLWGKYQYIPDLSMIFGVPGALYSYKAYDPAEFDPASSDIWVEEASIAGMESIIYSSSSAFDIWKTGADTNFVGFIFDMENDKGIVGVNVDSSGSCIDVDDCISLFYNKHQWAVDYEYERIYISVDESLNPNYSTARVGMIYPWALRPAFKSREQNSPFRDEYKYGPDDEAWTADDEYVYYGANVAESWFQRSNDAPIYTDWQPTTGAYGSTHGTSITAGDIYGGIYTTYDDTYPLLATSTIPESWPKDPQLGSFWPGWYAEILQEGTVGGVDQTEGQATIGTFISDEDVYMEFDDRWAHRGNPTTLGSNYNHLGYPMGIKVRAMAHSYGIAYAEDVVFVTIKVRNESGAFYDEKNVWHPAMTMPDGSVLNGGKGFNYRNAYLGFYFDVDAFSAQADGDLSGRSNDDDMMGFDPYYRFAYIYDLDGVSSGLYSDLAYTSIKLLDTPLSSSYLDTDGDGSFDVEPGDTLGMSDWHYFSWYARPGVVSKEDNNPSCYAGSEGCPVALNKEEIQYKLMAGDTTNLSENESSYYFHNDENGELNPHFDSMSNLLIENPDGLDCVLIMSCGPFDLDVGEETFFSFAIIMGQNLEDLQNNALMAQLMYDESYSGFSPPAKPEVYAVTDHERVTLYWDDAAENSVDRITGYRDFEGYKLYKSLDGGKTWGGLSDMIFDPDGIHVGWRPLEIFDLTLEEDENWPICDTCTYNNNKRDRNISGPDPLAPWFSLGSNSGIVNSYVDTLVDDGVEYTYAVTSYDMGIEGDYSLEINYDSEYYEFILENPNFDVSIDTTVTEITTGAIDSIYCSNINNHPQYNFFWNEGDYFTIDNNFTVNTPVGPGTVSEWCAPPLDQCIGLVNGLCDTLINTLATEILTEIDTNVIILSYDTTYTDTFPLYEVDTVWSNTNPDNWASPGGLISLETSKGTSTRDKNFVTVVPGYKPTNVSLYPDLEDGESMFEELDAFGNGEKNYIIVNEEWNPEDYELDLGLNDNLYLYTVSAEPDVFSYQNVAVKNPSLFAYQVNYWEGAYLPLHVNSQTHFLYEMAVDDTSYLDSVIYTPIVDEYGDFIKSNTIDSIFNLPGVSIEEIDSVAGTAIIEKPVYEVNGFDLQSNREDQLGDNWSEFHNGIMVQFQNQIRQEEMVTPTGEVPIFNPSGYTHLWRWHNNIDTMITDFTNIPENSECVQTFMDGKDFPHATVDKYFDYQIIFGDSSHSYNIAGMEKYNFNINGVEVKSGGGVAKCESMMEIANENYFPFTVINKTTGSTVKLVQGAGTDSDSEEFRLGDEIWFFEPDVADSTYYNYENVIYDDCGDCECTGPLAYKTFKFYIWVQEFPPQFPLCPYDIACCGVEGQPLAIPWADGDTAEIITTKPYSDGDSWILDMSKFAQDTRVTQEDLEKVDVVPNPYIVRSGLNESKFSRRMMFTKLPDACTIKIFTVTGEQIRTLDHNDTFSSIEYWDLRTDNNQEIAPGLYLYTVEADGKKHIGKFAVIR